MNVSTAARREAGSRSRAMKKLSRWIPTGEAGQAYIEFLIILPILLLFIAAILYFGRVLYASIAADVASYDCVRTAAEALKQDNGVNQGITAAYNTMRGFYLDTSGVRVQVWAPGGWERGNEVRCRVTYGISLRGVPFVHLLDIPNVFPVRSTTYLRIEEYKSRWE
ncbi:MAG: hypothetical protein D6796_17020 [Caldilineae bacterium]|nr:MAG: hypothetical protein D6796_17020 [Caldilineae bacterium]